MKRLINTPILSMAMVKADAIDLCMNLGKKFIEHFNKVVTEGVDSPSFPHHCDEMQAWYDKVSTIVLKHNNKKIRKDQLWDWFFTVGTDIEGLISAEQLNTYGDLYLQLSLHPNLKIKSILKEVLTK